MNNPTLAYSGNCGTATGALGNPNTYKNDGVMIDTTQTGNSGRISLDDISNGDGTANTLVLSEECGASLSAVSSVQFWDVRPPAVVNTTNSGSFGLGGMVTSYTASNTTPIPAFGLSGATPPSKVINTGTGNSNPGYLTEPSSNHPGGAVVAFCDGHTGFLKDSLASYVYAHLITSKSTSNGTNYTSTNSANADSWLRSSLAPNPYVLSEGDFQ